MQPFFSHISSNSIRCIQDLCTQVVDTHTKDTHQDMMDKILALLKITLQCNQLSSNLYTKSSTYIELGADPIATEQAGLLKRSIIF